jgi:amino acid transporter
MLSCSRVPFAAAQGWGIFFKIFARLHQQKIFLISLLVLAAFFFVFSLLLFRMGDVISGILTMRIMVQFIKPSVGLMLLRKEKLNLHLKCRYINTSYTYNFNVAVVRLTFLYATGLAIDFKLCNRLVSGCVFTKTKFQNENSLLK